MEGIEFQFFPSAGSVLEENHIFPSPLLVEAQNLSYRLPNENLYAREGGPS